MYRQRLHEIFGTEVKELRDSSFFFPFSLFTSSGNRRVLPEMGGMIRSQWKGQQSDCRRLSRATSELPSVSSTAPLSLLPPPFLPPLQLKDHDADDENRTDQVIGAFLLTGLI